MAIVQAAGRSDSRLQPRDSQAVRVRRIGMALDEVLSRDRMTTTAPTMKLFQRVAAEMVGNANAEMTTQAPAAALRNRNQGAPIEINATAKVTMPMTQVFVYCDDVWGQRTAEMNNHIPTPAVT